MYIPYINPSKSNMRTMTFASPCLCEQHDHPSLIQFLKGINFHSCLFHFPNIQSVTKSFFLLRVFCRAVLAPPVRQCDAGAWSRAPASGAPPQPQSAPLGQPEPRVGPLSCAAGPHSATRRRMCASATLSSSRPPCPLAYVPPSTFASPALPWEPVHLYHFLDCTCMH